MKLWRGRREGEERRGGGRGEGEGGRGGGGITQKDIVESEKSVKDVYGSPLCGAISQSLVGSP